MKKYLLVFILIFCFYPQFIFSQEIVSNELKLELISIYNNKGEAGLIDYAKFHKEILSIKIIRELAKEGLIQAKEELLKIAFVLAEELKDKKTIANVNYQYARYILVTKGDPTDYLDKALSIYKELNDTLGQGQVYFCQGDSYIRKDDLRAREMYFKALTYFEKINYLIGQGKVFCQLGTIYIDMGDDQRSLDMYSKALTYFEKANYLFGQANTFFVLGRVYYYAGDYQKALELYMKARLIYEKEEDIQGQGNIFSWLGKVYFETGAYQNALEMYSKALPFYEKEKDPLGQGIVYDSQGIVYSATGNNQLALEMYSKALPNYEKAKDLLGQGNIYFHQGKIFFQTGAYQNALEMYSKALTFYNMVKNPGSQGNVYLNQGDVYAETGNNQLSLEFYSKALQNYQKVNDPIGQGNVYKNQGDLYIRTGNNQLALEMYSKSLSFYEKTNSIYNEASLLLSKAKLFDKTKQLKNAYDLYEMGFSKLEKVRSQIGFSEMKMGFLEKIGDEYNNAIQFMLANNYNDKAFEYYENTKARTLLDQITEKNILGVEKGISDTLKQRRDDLNTKISFCQSQLTKTTDTIKIEELKTQYKLYDEEYEKLKQEIRFQNPLYAAVNYPKSVAINELQKDILKPDEALLQYYFGDSSAYVFLVTKDLFKVVKLSSSGDEIEKEAKEFYDKVLTSEKNPYTVNTLYKKIIEPLKEYIKDKRTLIIVPDGILSFIPFEAIYVESGDKIKYLFEDYNIKYIQSGTMLSLLRKELEKGNTNNSFIGFGDPVYDYENYIAKKPEKGEVAKEEQIALLTRDNFERAGGKLNRLEGSGQEVEEISKMFGTKPYLRIEATEERAKSQELKNYGYVLFSCHALLSDEFQSLVLSQIPSSKEDGYLTASEIMNLDWNAKLVVLSACQTGKGQVKKGEGVVGFTRALMLAGTPAAVVSLWSVSDKGTKELMVRFFRNIAEKKLSKEEALKQAKIEMLKTDYHNPYYWSSFVMYGE